MQILGREKLRKMQKVKKTPERLTRAYQLKEYIFYSITFLKSGISPYCPHRVVFCS